MLHQLIQTQFQISVLAVGFRNTKAGGVIQLTDSDKAKKLPQHDFGNPDVYVTPSSFRVMTWKTELVNGKFAKAKSF